MTEEKNIQAELSKEQLSERQKEIHEYYTSQVPFLEAQKQYETLITELEELELRRMMARMRMAQLMAPPPDESESEDETVKKPRSLKKD
jgi:hypothetical protein